jgi:hypothetical protein
MPVADVLDLSELEVNAKVGELDRANLKEDQDVVIALDAVPEKKFHGKIKSMSGTASSNFFSGDPAKKFDVTFSIDMRQLLKELGASEDQIRRVLATAEENRKKPVAVSMSSFAMGGMMGGVPGGMAGGTADVPGAAMVAGGAGGQGEEGAQAPGGGGRRGMAGGGGGLPGMADMSDEDRQKMRAAFQKALGGRNMQDLSQEERQKILTQAMQSVGRPASGAKPAAGAKAGETAAPRAAGGPPALVGRGPGGAPGEGSQSGQGSEARARRGGEGRGSGEGRGGQGGTMGMLGGSGGQFTPKDLENAKLPPPPEEESQLDVLIRPGLLTDVEIIVEKIPNAIHIPNQAVFEKGGKLVAFVQQTSGRWEEREIKPLKRSESTMVISAGLKPGETVALADPNERPGEGKKKKQQQEKGASGGGGGTPMGGMGAGGKGGK